MVIIALRYQFFCISRSSFMFHFMARQCVSVLYKIRKNNNDFDQGEKKWGAESGDEKQKSNDTKQGRGSCHWVCCCMCEQQGGSWSKRKANKAGTSKSHKKKSRRQMLNDGE